jgi:hypothetical protein
MIWLETNDTHTSYSYVHVLASRTAAPISQSQTNDWYHYVIEAREEPGPVLLDQWMDFAHLGYSYDYIYVAGNMYPFGSGGSFQYSKVHLYDKTALFSGALNSYLYHYKNQLKNPDGSYAFSISPARSLVCPDFLGAGFLEFSAAVRRRTAWEGEGTRRSFAAA